MRLDKFVARLKGDLERQSWRMSKIMRPGVVAEYDPEKHRARIKLNETGFLSPWCRIIESAGAGTSRTTLTQGQTVWLFCPDGDLRQGQVMAGAFSDQFKPGSSEAEETRFERNGVHVSIRPEGGEMLMGPVRVAIRETGADITHGTTTIKVEDGLITTHTTGQAHFT